MRPLHKTVIRPLTKCVAVLIIAASMTAFLAFPFYRAYRGHAVITLGAALLAMSLVVKIGSCSIADRIGKAVMAPSRLKFGWAVFLAGLFWFSFLSLFLFDGGPVLDDDVSAFFQARIFLSGHLRIPAPQPPEFFSQFAMISGTHGVSYLCSMYPFGHPLVLLPFLALGAPWLAMPVFAAGTCVMAASAARLLFDERIARLAALTCLTSPMFAELGSTFLNHAPTAFGILLAITGFLKCMAGKGGTADGLFVGLGLSLAFLCRPADAAACGVVIGIGALSRPARAWKARGPWLAALAVLACAVFCHILWTQLQTGNWRTPGHAFCMRGMGKYGFTPLFTPKKAVWHAFLRTMALGAKATGWPVTVFIPALIPLLQHRRRWASLWLLAFPAALSTLYFFFFWYEHCFPARYLFASLPALVLCASAGWTIAADAAGISLSRLVAVPAAMALLVYLPFHLSSFDDHWYDVERTLPRVMKAADLHNAVVVQSDVGLAVDRADRMKKYYAAAFMRNDLDFDGDVIYVRNRYERNNELPSLFPGREIYFYRYRRDKNLAELYRMEFAHDGKDPSYTFLDFPGLEGYTNPDVDGISIGNCKRLPPPGDGNDND